MAAVEQYLDDSVDERPDSSPVPPDHEPPTIAAAYDFSGDPPTSRRKPVDEDSIVSLSLSGALSELLEDSSLDGIPQVDEPISEEAPSLSAAPVVNLFGGRLAVDKSNDGCTKWR